MTPPVVIKVGGSLAAEPATLRIVAATLATLAADAPILVVPGGGPFADTVRAVDDQYSLPASSAHWMAILGMDQYAHLLAAVIPGGEVVSDQGGIAAVRQRGGVPVLAPSQWLAAADEVPHSWEVTSDSLAAYLATLLGAERLLLVKSVESGGEELVDPYFRRVLPAGIRWRAVGPLGLTSIGDWLRADEPA
ncbi:MAG: hypothetical protein ABJC74_17925 [Gemmatimonadota bacterium]